MNQYPFMTKPQALNQDIGSLKEQIMKESDEIKNANSALDNMQTKLDSLKEKILKKLGHVQSTPSI